MKQAAAGNLLNSAGRSAQCSVTTERAWDGVGWEREGGPKGRGCMYAVVQQKQRQHCKAIILQLENN